MYKIIGYILITMTLVSCFQANTKENRHEYYIAHHENYIGSGFHLYPNSGICIKKNLDNYYYECSHKEHTWKRIFNTEGICTTIYKVRKKDNILVDFRYTFTHNKYDCQYGIL